MKWSKNFLLFSAIVLVAVCPSVLAQRTGTIEGVVQDEQGAIIPGVEVTTRSLDTGVARTIISDEEGRYVATSLDLGAYEVRAELVGFQTAVRTGISLSLGSVAVVNLTLRVGEISQEVVVTGDAPLIETTSSSITGLVDERKIRDLPLNTRSYTDLATLQVGVTKFTQRSSATTGYGDQLSFAGSRMDSNVYLLDGATVNNVYNKAPNSGSGGVIGVEAVREFQVLTNTYSAQYGRSMGGQLNSVTRSGTNAFHGSIYEFHRNDNLDARNFFEHQPFLPASLPEEESKPEFKRNQFGFALGGPIVPDKTFIFGNYEGFRERLGVTQFGSILDEQAREGIITDVDGNVTDTVVVHDPLKPYLANRDLFPLPNGKRLGDGRGELVYGQTIPVDEDFFIVRGDHYFSDSDSFMMRYAFNEGDNLFGGGFDVFRSNLNVKHHYVTMEEKHIFSPQLLNVFRFSFNREENNLTNPERGVIPQSLWFNDNVLTGGLEGEQGMGSIGGGGAPGSDRFGPKIFHLNVFEYADDMNYTRGAHSLKFGALVSRTQLNILGALEFRGSWFWNNDEDFLQGIVREFRAQTPDSDGIRGMRQTLIGFYIQDDYKMTPSLTWNLGLRWEMATVPGEVNGKVANLLSLTDLEIHTPTIAHTHTSDPGAIFSPVPTPHEADAGYWGDNASLKNFAPRIGFAWDLFGDGKTSLRGGYGIFYDQMLYNLYNLAYYRAPPFMQTAFIRGGSRGPATFPDAFQLIVDGTASIRNSIHTVQGNPSQPYLQQWNFTLQREILPEVAIQVGYIGSRGTHLGRLVDNTAYSEIAPASAEFPGRLWIPEEIDGIQNRGERRNPNFAEIRQRTLDANSYYHAAVLSLNKRFSQGFGLQVSYTYSRSIDEKSNLIGFGENSGDSQWALIPEDPRFDRGLSTFDVRHNMVSNFSYNIPRVDLGGIGGMLINGWQVKGIVSLSTGPPVTPTINNNSAGDGRSRGQGARPDLEPGKNINTVLGGLGGSGEIPYFDTTVFNQPPTGYFGNAGRSTIISPGNATTDFSLVKETPVPSISEQFTVQFRVELFNAFNRPNFGRPAAQVWRSSTSRNSTAGRIRQTTGTSRQIQLGLRLVW